jgi:hypothetical protein
VPFSDARGVRRYCSFFDVVRLYRALSRERPDVILQFVGTAHTGIAALYARRHGCKMIWRVTNDPSVEAVKASWLEPHLKLERLFLNFGIRNANLILAQTDYQRARLKETFPSAPVQVLPNFHPAAPDCGRSGAVVKQVAWVANLKPLKNPGAFVAARVRAPLRYAFRDGRGTTESDWTKQSCRESPQPNLEYRGAVSQRRSTAPEDTNLLVTHDYEGFSRFIQGLDAAPVVSTVDPDRLSARRARSRGG